MTAIRVVYGLGLGVLLTLMVYWGLGASYQGGGEDHARNIFIIACACGLGLTIVSLLLPPRLNVIRLGLLTGGLLSVLQAAVVGYGDIDLWWGFGGLGVEAVLLLILGYVKLINPRRPVERVIMEEDV